MTAQTILPANSVSGEFDVANSMHFDGTSNHNHKTPSSSGSQRKFTFSAWVKKTDFSSGVLLSSGEADGNPNLAFYFDSSSSFNGEDTFDFSYGANGWQGWGGYSLIDQGLNPRYIISQILNRVPADGSVFSDQEFDFKTSLGCKVVADYKRKLIEGLSWKSNFSGFFSYEGSDLHNWTWINGFSTAYKGIGVGLELGLRNNKQEALARELSDNPLQVYYVLGLTYSI